MSNEVTSSDKKQNSRLTDLWAYPFSPIHFFYQSGSNRISCISACVWPARKAKSSLQFTIKWVMGQEFSTHCPLIANNEWQSSPPLMGMKKKKRLKWETLSSIFALQKTRGTTVHRPSGVLISLSSYMYLYFVDTLFVRISCLTYESSMMWCMIDQSPVHSTPC